MAATRSRLLAGTVVTGALLVPLAVFGSPAIAQTLSAAHQYGSGAACAPVGPAGHQYGSAGQQYASAGEQYGSADAQYGPSARQYGRWPSPACRQYRKPAQCPPWSKPPAKTSAGQQYAKPLHRQFCGKWWHGKHHHHGHGHGHGKH